MPSITCEDCMALMARYPDKHFDLAIVDPPYGIGKNWKKNSKGSIFPETTYANDSIPDREYFNELFRVSRDVIVFGYNYYTEMLGQTNYLIVWDITSAKTGVVRRSKCEIAYTTIRIPANIISTPWDGCRMGYETGIGKIHPHQKPIRLYEEILMQYAKPGFRILDTHLVSGSIAIACRHLGFDLTACEIDKTYYEAVLRTCIQQKGKQDDKIAIKEAVPKLKSRETSGTVKFCPSAGSWSGRFPVSTTPEVFQKAAGFRFHPRLTWLSFPI